MQLLKPLRQNEYPADFLLARLKGRSGRIRLDWNSLRAVGDPVLWGHPAFMARYLRDHREDGPWIFLFHEFGWVRSRMNSSLRNTFFPVFLYFELFNLLAALRFREQGNLVDRIDAIASYSQLDDSLFGRIRNESSMENIINELAQSFAPLAPGFERAWQAYFEGGFPVLDQALLEELFSYWSSRVRSVLLRIFLRQLIDATNLLGLYKAMQWNVEKLPAPVPGGTLEPRLFIKGFEKGKMDTLLGKAGVGEVVSEQESGTWLECAVFLNLRKMLKRNVHEPSGVGYILFYLWEHFMFVRQYSLMLRSRHVHEDFFQKVLSA